MSASPSGDYVLCGPSDYVVAAWSLLLEILADVATGFALVGAGFVLGCETIVGIAFDVIHPVAAPREGERCLCAHHRDETQYT